MKLFHFKYVYIFSIKPCTSNFHAREIELKKEKKTVPEGICIYLIKYRKHEVKSLLDKFTQMIL